jgi:O-antigen/teichoic acid export membrane protein
VSVYRALLKQSGTYFAAVMLSRLISFVCLPVYTRYLTPADYGVLELLDTTTYLFGALVGVRLGEALLYFYAEAESAREKARVASTAMLAGLLLGIAIVGLGGAQFLSGLTSNLIFRSAGYTPLFRLAFVGLGLGIAVEVGLCYLRALDSATHFAAVSIGRILVGIVVTVFLLVVRHAGVTAMLVGNIFSGAAAAAYLAGFLFWKSGMAFDWRGCRNQIRYAAPLTISGLLMFFIHSGDRIFLQRSASLTTVGIYALAYRFGMLVSVIHNPFSLYWSSQMFNIVRKDNGDRVYVRIFTYLIAVLAVAGLLISLYIQPILRVMSAPDFRSAAVFVPWIALAYVARGVGDQARSIFSIHKLPGKHLHVTLIGAAACAILYSTLIPPFGAWGAVFATLGTFLLMMFLSVWQAQRIRSYPLEYGRMLHIVASAAAAVVLYSVIHPQGSLLQITVATLILAAWGVYGVAAGLIQSDEKEMIKEMLSQFRSRARAAIA